MRLLRIERDTRIAKTDWRASSDLTLSDAWKTYRQALRDLPASATPKLNSDYELDLTSVLGQLNLHNYVIRIKSR